jgi:hypothetical protein
MRAERANAVQDGSVRSRVGWNVGVVIQPELDAKPEARLIEDLHRERRRRVLGRIGEAEFGDVSGRAIPIENSVRINCSNVLVPTAVRPRLSRPSMVRS